MVIIPNLSARVVRPNLRAYSAGSLENSNKMTLLTGASSKSTPREALFVEIKI